MHELSISSGIIEVARRAIASQPLTSRVLRVDVRVGRLTGIVPDILRHYYALLTVGTALDGSALAVAVVPIRARCSDCSVSFEVDDVCFTCPRCGSGFLEISSGRELEVVSLETADDGNERRAVVYGN
ncbi:MAG TPA: hydrogenase maturation nickel metallochaperone HypA [Candidatus Binatia bacterium]|nr:hydrogenase maturation nickel metallochaperone HypA [Candidatus Binatia bacterium]